MSEIKLYFVQKVARTKGRAARSSYIISLPARLRRKIRSHNFEISERLEGFPRVRFVCNDMAGSRIFALAVPESDYPPVEPPASASTTTVQRSGKVSRYVIIPKRVCKAYRWKAGTELVIGFGYNVVWLLPGEMPEGLAMENVPRVEECIIKFQRYRDMREAYRRGIEGEKEEIGGLERAAVYIRSERPWAADRTDEELYYWKKNMRRDIGNWLYDMDLAAVSYADFVRLRADRQREWKKRRQAARKRQGSRSGWQYRKRFVHARSYDYDQIRENRLDDPDTYLEARGDDPESFSKSADENSDGEVSSFGFVP